MDYSRILSTWWSGTCYHKEQLDMIISSSDVHRYAYILHDKDKQPDSDELKKPHYHFLVQFTRTQRGAWFKAFGTDDMGIVFYERCTIPKSHYDYLIHDTPTCRKQGKHLYDPAERVSTIENLDTPEKDGQSSITEKFFTRLHSGAANMDLQREFPTLYAQYGVDKIEKFRQDKLKEEHGQKFREIQVTFIYGSTRLGKTTFVYGKYPLTDICRVNNYERGTFEDYQNQKILVLDEFTGKIDITFLNNLLDRFPVNLPARYANRTACFDEVYIISNLPLDRLYTFEKQSTPEVYAAFTERIKNIIRFTGFLQWHYELKDGKPVPPPKQAKLTELIPVDDDGDLPF
jgi:hypothetical protein